MQMDVRWLGWAGFELTVAGTTILIDPLADPSAVFAALGEEAKAIADPMWSRPRAGVGPPRLC